MPGRSSTTEDIVPSVHHGAADVAVRHTSLTSGVLPGAPLVDAQKVTEMLRETCSRASAEVRRVGSYMEDKLSGATRRQSFRMQIDRMRELLGEGSDDERLIYDTIEDNNGLTLFDSKALRLSGRRVCKLQ